MLFCLDQARWVLHVVYDDLLICMLLNFGPSVASVIEKLFWTLVKSALEIVQVA